MDLARVKGLGPGKVKALKAAGITTAQQLAQIDLRRPVEVDGISQEGLKEYKQNARKALQDAGISFKKAPYRTGRPKKSAARSKAAAPRKASARKTASPSRAAPAPKAASEARPPPKRGFFKRLLGRD